MKLEVDRRDQHIAMSETNETSDSPEKKVRKKEIKLVKKPVIRKSKLSKIV